MLVAVGTLVSVAVSVKVGVGGKSTMKGKVRDVLCPLALVTVRLSSCWPLPRSSAGTVKTPSRTVAAAPSKAASIRVISVWPPASTLTSLSPVIISSVTKLLSSTVGASAATSKLMVSVFSPPITSVAVISTVARPGAKSAAFSVNSSRPLSLWMAGSVFRLKLAIADCPTAKTLPLRLPSNTVSDVRPLT